ncbi:hypothetical protein PMG11_06770 [Penicillium brasilianum]|uniref:Uncharacterized protein n=1 Tax=Penicillium brasilianum TaxID=104259 RepID=A0A0F7TRQ3_PENBI|nr:hypothetical protein PMG11_06770 [Penicillium brasilianum]
MTTYLQYHAISQEIQNMPQMALESVSYGIWNAILSVQFPVPDGYIVRSQDRHTPQPGRHGYSDFHVFHYRANATNAVKFLIVQCKRPGTENWDSVWATAVDQLNEYLSATHGNRPPAARSPVYGIAAVGRATQFYKYNDIKQEVSPWKLRGMRKDVLDLKGDAVRIQQMLDHIRDNH